MGGVNRTILFGRRLLFTILISMLFVFPVLAAERTYFSIPEEAYWSEHDNGVARWTKVDKAKQYEVVLYRDGSRVKKVTVKGTRADLSEYMKNNQVYTFAVRAIPTDNQKSYRAGEWMYSDELAVDWLGTTSGRWRNYSTGKKYQKEDKSYCVGWEKINGIWYYFNEEGYAQTGWISLGDKRYYLDEEGKMLTGWLQQGEDWYYLDPSGAMLTGWVQGGGPGSWYYLGADGKMLSNTVVEGHQLDGTGLMIN